ncbi:MAG: hypothetical protein KAQ93_04465 [Spirochaetales bacterium]|nr:hypothetical protein [Spirochaetales bacterium]
MLYSIIEIDDQNLKNSLVRSCDDQPFIAAAPLVLLFLADYQRTYDFFISSGVKEYGLQEGKQLPGILRNIFTLKTNTGDWISMILKV